MGGTEIAAMLILGGMAGFLSGMFGIGGGLIIVPALVVIFDFDTKTAIGTSLFALLLPTGLLGVLEYWRRGELRVQPGLLIAMGLFCGAYLGARLTGLMPADTVKKIYGTFLIVVAIYFFWSSGRSAAEPPAQPRLIPGPELAPESSARHPVH
jgi:uncharacterized membrane protein YfcA